MGVSTNVKTGVTTGGVTGVETGVTRDVAKNVTTIVTTGVAKPGNSITRGPHPVRSAWAQSETRAKSH